MEDKMKNTKILLKKGEVLIYDFGSIKIHNYNTNDNLNDQVIILEKDKKIVVIESPTFYDNNKELEEYITSLNAEVIEMLISYHMSGGSFLKDKKKYTTSKASTYGMQGGGKALIDGFTVAFGSSFDKNIHNITDYINEGSVTLAGINLNIISTNDAFDVEIPEINVIYTHMLGSNSHSIIANENHAKMLIKTLESYISKNYNLILTSHYIPESIEAASIKIDYIKDILNIAKTSKGAKEMISKVTAKYPTYVGLNYLEMTANSLFNN